MANQRAKVAITGSAGQIGYALLFRLASGQMFGPNVDLELRLLELPQALSALQGVAMELEDCAFPLLRNIVCTADVNEAMDGVNYVILVGAVPRKEGMERSDLLAVNGKIFTAQGKAINDRAADDVKVFVVGNPCNTNCLITMHNALDVPNDRFYAMTMLDQNRAVTQLANKANVAVTEIEHMVIWGNHSATQYPDFYQAKIAGRPALEVIDDENWLQNDFIKIIQQRGAQVIKARGASSAASAANAVVDSIYHLSNDTEGDQWFSVATCSRGEYGVDEGLIFSYPSRMENQQLRIIEGIEHNEFAQNKLQITLQELRDERDAVKELGLI